MKKVALLTVHGMGTTPKNYADEITAELQKRLRDKFAGLHVGSVYYQEILQANEEKVWNRLPRRVKWDELRKFLLYGFADAAGLENGKDALNSVYSSAQALLAKELNSTLQTLGPDGTVVILAQSLGCQVVSCYFWDAIKYRSGKRVVNGIWQDIRQFEPMISGGKTLDPSEISFLQGSSFRHFLTTGCNIPIFVAAHPGANILPIRPNDVFSWHNYYDRYDILGWPLSDLSTEYSEVVFDHQVNAGSGVFGWLLKSWNPLSHGQYWGDDEILDPLESALREYL